MGKFFILAFFYGVIFTYHLHQLQGEVQSVKFSWTATLCQTSCPKQLEKEFRKIPGVTDVITDFGAGQAELHYQPNAPFSWTPIQRAMQMVGLYIKSMRVKVHGTIVHNSQNVTLVSIGDGTRFEIVNAVIPNTQGQSNTYNLSGARALTPQMRQKFLDAEALGQEATIEGPLFMPHRAPPLQIVAEQINFSNPNQTPSKK